MVQQRYVQPTNRGMTDDDNEELDIEDSDEDY